MKFVLQMLTGSFSQREEKADLQEMISRLGNAFALLPVENVIFGWYMDREMNSALIEYIHANGKKAWLWTPVFSETPECVDSDRQVGYAGAGTASGENTEGRDFNFACPSSEKNRAITFDLYQGNFSGLGFDGVFLDKIRQGGFADGLERALGCFCPRCKERYAGAGVNVDRLIDKVVRNPKLLLPASYENCRYAFEDKDVDAYFAAKAACISEGVTGVVQRFKELGLMVGLDTFAPLAAWFVGQDIQVLAKSVDFIKPMLYRRTNAPAGLPYEMESIEACIPGDETRACFCKLWGVEDICSEDSVRKQFLDMKGAGCAIYPGFEIHQRRDDDPKDTGYVTSSAALYAGAGAEQVVLCWNLLGNTGINISALSKMNHL